MLSNNYKIIRALTTLIVSLLILGLLIWQYFHEGVPDHHILQQKDLPEISNWWGGLLLPLLTWVLMGKLVKRLAIQNAEKQPNKNSFYKIVGLFALGLIFGLLITISFTNNYKPFLDNVPYIFLITGFFIPIFYAEFILGFILGMTYFFGAILPTIFILILSSFGYLIYTFIRPLFIRFIKVFGK